MGWLLAEKTLCLFEVDLKGAAAPACAARLAVECRMLDAAAWAVQRYTSHIPDRHFFQLGLPVVSSSGLPSRQTKSSPIAG